MGYAYALADAAFIGGTLGATEGHNPWEAIAFKTPVIHGPRGANFAQDYALLAQAGAALKIANGPELAAALMSPELPMTAQRASACVAAAHASADQVATRLLALLATEETR